jgi:hypothetical protein
MAGYALIRVDRIDKVNGSTHDPLYWNAQQLSPSGWREIHRSMDIKHGLISGKSNKNVQEAQEDLMALLGHQRWRLDPDIEENDLPNYLGFHMTLQLPPDTPEQYEYCVYGYGTGPSFKAYKQTPDGSVKFDESVSKGTLASRLKAAGWKKIPGEEHWMIRRIQAEDSPEALSTPPTAPARDSMETLKKLGQLRDAGVVTEEEFQSKKTDLLAEL